MKILFAATLLLAGTTAMAQPAGRGDGTLTYQEKIRNSGDLYYGIEHTGYPQKLQGFAYYLSPDWLPGSVSYKGVWYTNVNLKYDLVADQLIVLHPNNVFAVTLHSPSVDSFTLAGQRFLYREPRNTPGLKQPGFYQQLVEGRISILARRAKIIEEKTTAEVEKKITGKDQFFSLVRGGAALINSEESLLQFTGDMARKIRVHLREKNIRFRKEKERAIIESAVYYNQSAI